MNRTLPAISSFFDSAVRSLEDNRQSNETLASFSPDRFATCSHDSKILNAGACPCSSMKILMKLDISSESFEILKTTMTMGERERDRERLACIDRRGSRVSSRRALCHSSDSNRDDGVYDWWRESDSYPERGQRNVYA